MSLEIVALLGLHGRQYAELGGLLSSAFPAVPPQLLEVEVARACEPRGGRGLVAVNVGQVAGVLVARRASACFVFVVYLATARRCRRGVARTLVDRLAEMTGAPLELCAADGNTAAERLYQAGGLIPDGGSAPAGQRRWSGTWQPASGAASGVGVRS